MAKKKSKFKALKITLSIVGSLILVLCILQCVCFISNAVVSYTYYYDKTSKVELDSILKKDTLSDEDYDLIYHQTGITKFGVDRTLTKYHSKQTIKKVQSSFLQEVKVTSNFLGPYCYYQTIDQLTEMVNVEVGDIIVSNGTQFCGKTFGHCGLVTSTSGGVLQSYGYGELSEIGTLKDFQERASFIILSPRVDSSIKAQVAEYAINYLQGIPYNVFIGLFGTKDSISSTQCSHLVWYAYHHFGYDFDNNGGGICLPHDLICLDQMDVVQVYGFDLDSYTSW